MASPLRKRTGHRPYGKKQGIDPTVNKSGVNLRLSLTRQALLLVAIPLCFEIACVGMLLHAQREAEMEAARAVKARRIADCITRLNNQFYKSWEAVMSFKQNWLRHRRIDLSFRNEFGPIKENYKELIALTDDQKTVQGNITSSMNQLDEADRIVAEAARDVEAGKVEEVLETHAAKMARLKQIFRTCMSHEMTIFAQHEKDVADSSHTRQAELRQQIVVYAVLAVVFSILFSAAIAAFVVKRITSRIGVVNDNAFRLGADQPLHPPMKGNDEIAQLDNMFHRMADEIQETARTKEDMVNMLTHDLRTPLTSIQGCFTMLDEGMLGTLNERGESMVKLADRNSMRMMNLINDLLDVQKIKSGMMTIETEDVELSTVFKEVRLNFEDWMKEHDLKMEVEETDLCVKADAEKLSRVLYNLVGNAFKFSPKGATIKMSAQKVGNVAQVSVKDEGRGIPKEAQKTIFDRFQQVKNDGESKGGSGLGLAICQMIVELHGGKIWVESEPGKGSVFTFTLPLSGRIT